MSRQSGRDETTKTMTTTNTETTLERAFSAAPAYILMDAVKLLKETSPLDIDSEGDVWLYRKFVLKTTMDALAKARAMAI